MGLGVAVAGPGRLTAMAVRCGWQWTCMSWIATGPSGVPSAIIAAPAERRVTAEYVFDRASDHLLAHAYRILVPERRERVS
jgi:hypothetical protein